MEIVPELLTTAEAATILNVTRVRVQQLVKAGTLAGEKRGRDYLIPRAEVEHYAQTRRSPGRPETTGAGKRRRDRQRQPQES